MDDDNFSIRYNPRTEGTYNEDDAKKTRPQNTNTTRNFRNVLDKDDDSKESSSKISKKPSSTSDEDESTALSIIDEEEAEKDSGFSLFMQRKTKVKLAKDAPSPSTDDDIIAKAGAEEAEEAEEVAEAKEFSEAQSESEVTPFAPPKEKAKVTVNVDVAPRELPKTVEKKLPEMAVAQQTTIQLPEKKELPSLYGTNRTNNRSTTTSTGKEKKEVDSPAALFAKKTNDGGPKVDKDAADKSGLGDFDEAGMAVVVDKSAQKKENAVNPFARDQQDLSTINAQGIVQPVAGVELTGVAAGSPKPVQASATLQTLIEQLVKEITVMTKGDKTETTLTLTQPPLFAGAQVSMTGFDSARGEVNITFANLTQNAQVIVQQQQQNLLAALESKGYHVHIFTATTVANEPIIAKAETNQSNKDQRGQGEGRGDRGDQQRHPQG